MDDLMMGSAPNQPAKPVYMYQDPMDYGGPVSISGPLALNAGYPLQRRPTNFGLQQNVAPPPPISVPSPAVPFQRRPSGSDAIPMPSQIPPVPPVANVIPSGQTPAMEVGLPTPNKPTGSPVKSLFQSCMSMIEKLYGFPLFEFYLFPDGVDLYQTDPPPLIDPVAILWGCFRLGAPLCMIYNQLKPKTPLNVSDVSSIRPPKYTNVCKDNVYHFIVACKKDMGLLENDVFAISELYKDDTNGFVKVLKTIHIVLERIEAQGLLPAKRPLPFSVPTQDIEAPTDNRSKLINEMIDTERKYINDLESLQNYKKEAINQNVLTKDEAYSLFANLDELLDFQRRFLIAMESTLSLPANEQRIGQLFSLNEDYFSVYIAFCGNYNFATTFILHETERFMKLTNMIAPIMLQSYFIKPVQRVCRYPLLLQELVKLSQNTSYPYLDELKEGLDSIKRVTERVNEQNRMEENRQMKNELYDKVEDWKGLKADDFGNLILSDKFLMSSNDTEKDFHLYLFERILLCCKDITKSRKKPKKSDKEGPTYALKGNIYVASIQDINDVESFALKGRNEEQIKLWKDRLEKQVDADRLRKRNNSVDNMANPAAFGQGPRQSGRSIDDYVDSAYGSSVYRPSFDGTPSPSTPQYHAPPLARSRSIPHNYYPMPFAPQQTLPPPPTSVSSAAAAAQRRSQVPMSRGYGSQADLPAAGYYHANSVPRALSASPDSASRYPRSFSPPPPVPPMPHHMMPQGHSRFPSEGSNDPMQMSPRLQAQMPTRSITVHATYARGGSGQGGVSLPVAPLRTISASSANNGAYMNPGMPSVFSEDEVSDDEYIALQRKYSQQGPVQGRMNESPLPNSNQRYNHQTRAAMTGVTAINTTRKQSLHADDERTTFNAGRQNTHFSSIMHPPVPPIPQGYLHNSGGVPLGRTPSGPELDQIGGMVGAGGSPRISPTSQYVHGQRPGYSPGTKTGPTNPYQVSAPDHRGLSLTGFQLRLNLQRITMYQTRNARSPVSGPDGGLINAFSNLTADATSPPGATRSGTIGPSGVMAGFIKVRTHYESDILLIAIPSKGASFAELQARIERKIRLCGGKSPAEYGRKMKIRYKDSDGDVIALNGDEDVELAFEGQESRLGRVLC
ncbi:hypothetical protein BC829DRAFT_447662 [Chytridium lagenaria]|nr:hypothetical protein BC829DRAFT_447662 [Chytridium lagenaria]